MYVDYAVNDSARVDGLKPVAMLLRQSLEPLLKVTYHATYTRNSVWYASQLGHGIDSTFCDPSIPQNHSVDLALWGHEHSYQRMCHFYQKQCDNVSTVHVIVGTGGQYLGHEDAYE